MVLKQELNENWLRKWMDGFICLFKHKNANTIIIATQITSNIS